MKRIFLILCILIFPIFSFGQWVDTGGSTWVATASEVEWEIKDVQNNIHDRPISAWRVGVASGSLDFVHDIINVVATSDTVTHTQLDAQFVLISTVADFTHARLEKIYVRDSTGTVKILEEMEKTYVLISTDTYTIIVEMIKHYVLISTGSDGTNTRLDTLKTEFDATQVLMSTNTIVVLSGMEKQYVLVSTNTYTIFTEMLKHYVLISTGTDGINTRIDTTNGWLDNIFVLISTNTAGSNDLLNKLYVQNSTAADTTITRLDTVNDELKETRIVISTGADTSIDRLDSVLDYLGSSVTVSDVRYSNRVSTGTGGKSFVDFSITITNYEMDGFSFYSLGGDTDVTSTWTDGIIYVLEGIPISEDISIPVSNPIFQCDLATGVTFYYFLNGVQP